jgi:hypothetical protein
MKNLLSRFKKSLGIVEAAATADRPQETAAPETTSSFIPATPVKREAIIGFIIQSLKPYVDERALSVAGLRFYILCADHEQEEAARVALLADRTGMFKAEYLERKLINHFIQLEPGWFFEHHIVKDQLPDNVIQQGNFALKVIRAGEQIVEHYSPARVEVLVGQAEQFEYILDPHTQFKFYIGRTKKPQLASGKIQQNDIVFLGKDDAGFNETIGGANLHVSRNHAYILYDPKNDQYFLYPDKGGLPDNGNKIKIHTADDKVKWLNIFGVAHPLQSGDQIELGGQAVLRFGREDRSQ